MCLEQVLAGDICQHLRQPSLGQAVLLQTRPVHSGLLSHDWQDSLDEDLGTLVVALDIVVVFDRVWYFELIEKLRAKGARDALLMLLIFKGEFFRWL